MNLVEVYHPPRMLRSSTDNKLAIPNTRLKRFGERAFHYSGPAIWNTIPSFIRQAATLSQFKKRLKTHLFYQLKAHLRSLFVITIFHIASTSESNFYAWTILCLAHSCFLCPLVSLLICIFLSNRALVVNMELCYMYE